MRKQRVAAGNTMKNAVPYLQRFSYICLPGNNGPQTGGFLIGNSGYLEYQTAESGRVSLVFSNYTGTASLSAYLSASSSWESKVSCGMHDSFGEFDLMSY